MMHPQFPADLEAPVLQLVHHHVSSLDQLVNKVYDALKPPESPAVQGKENEQAAAGKAKAPKHPLSKQLTRCWLLEVCVRAHTWQLHCMPK